MGMKTGILINFLEANFISSESLKAVYSFDLFSSRIIFNNLYPSGSQVISGNLSLANAEYFPMISIGSTNNPTSDSLSISGSGCFKGEDTLRLYKPVSSEDWTIFFNLNRPTFPTPKVPEVVFTTALSGNYSSGLVFGINDSNKFFLEHKDSSSEKVIHTSKNELNNKQVTSLSKLKNNIYLSLHNAPDRENTEEVFAVTNEAISHDWVFGNFKSGTSNFTGYSGYVDDIVLFSGFLDYTTRNMISETFFMSGYSSGFFMDSGAQSEVVTGVNINPTGITGTGITGYSYQLIEIDQGLSVYSLSGLTGNLTGEVITFLTGVASGGPMSQVFVQEEKLFDYDYFKQYAAGNILFTKFISPTDLVEVYAREVPVNNLNLEGIYSSSITGYTLPSGYSSGNVNVYLSGKALHSGEDFEILNSYKIKINKLFSGTEDLIYDVITGAQYVSGFTGYVGAQTITNTNFASRDLYLNGKKLISGFDYTQNSTQTILALNSLNETGTLLFFPRPTGVTKKLFIEGSNFIDVNFDLLDERVWLNGLRQQKGIDYIKTPDNSLLNSNTFIYSSSSPIYRDEDTYFNI